MGGAERGGGDEIVRLLVVYLRGYMTFLFYLYLWFRFYDLMINDR